MTEILKSPSFPNGLPPSRSEDEVRAARDARLKEEMLEALKVAYARIPADKAYDLGWIEAVIDQATNGSPSWR